MSDFRLHRKQSTTTNGCEDTRQGHACEIEWVRPAALQGQQAQQAAQRTAAARAAGRCGRTGASAWSPLSAAQMHRCRPCRGRHSQTRQLVSSYYYSTFVPVSPIDKREGALGRSTTAERSSRCWLCRCMLETQCAMCAAVQCPGTAHQCGAKPWVPAGVRYELQPTGHCRKLSSRAVRRHKGSEKRCTAGEREAASDGLVPLGSQASSRVAADDDRCSDQPPKTHLWVQHAHRAAFLEAAPHCVRIRHLRGCMARSADELDLG